MAALGAADFGTSRRADLIMSARFILRCGVALGAHLCFYSVLTSCKMAGAGARRPVARPAPAESRRSPRSFVH